MSLPKRHKVLFISSWFPNRLDPFLGNFVERHAEAVSEFADVASLYVCSDPRVAGTNFEVETKTTGKILSVNVYYKKVNSRIPFVSRLCKFFRYRKAHELGYAEIVKHFSGPPDLVHLNVVFPAGLFALRLKKRSGIPYIITEHSTQYHVHIPPTNLSAMRMICRNAELICPVSDDLTNVMQKRGMKGRYEKVPNVVDTDLFHIAANGNAKKKIIHISTLKDWQKNISGMLRVIRKLADKRNDFELHIVSDSDLTLTRELVTRHGLLNEQVFLYPAQPIEKIAEMMRSSDLFLLFSNFENLPCVIIEALASGIPVVSTRVGGVPELVNETNGLLVDPGDERALLEKLGAMLDKHNSYNKEEIRKFAVTHFSYRAVGQEFNSIYNRVLDEKQKRNS